ncbi:hypothetical protein HHI36_022946, partial [Cryptolaemus montrouzieri]
MGNLRHTGGREGLITGDRDKLSPASQVGPGTAQHRATNAVPTKNRNKVIKINFIKAFAGAV